MPTISHFSGRQPTSAALLSNPNRWVATMAEQRRQLEEDREVLRAREQNLRQYEDRLRALQAEIEEARTAPDDQREAASTVTPTIFQRRPADAPVPDEAALSAAWGRLHRARVLLEAEQAHLRDERLELGEQQRAIECREETVAQREQHLAQREAHHEAATSAAQAAPAPAASSLSRMPFQFARLVLGGK